MSVDLSPPRVSLSAQERAHYEEHGWVGPFPLLGAHEIQGILDEYPRTIRALDWSKSQHVFEGPIVDALRREALVGRVASILGDDLFVWCSQLLMKTPQQHHRWHVDIETLDWTSVNVWVALRNVTVNATVLLLPKTHTLDVTPQELARTEGLDLFSSDAVKAAAKAKGVEADVVAIDVRPGEFVLFDGLLWHGSINTTGAERWALLTQYSSTTERARQPKTFVPPIEWMSEPPPCLLVRGVDRGGNNNYVVPGPPPALPAQVAMNAKSRIGSIVHKVRDSLR